MCCQYPSKTVPTCEIEMVILDQVKQKHQIPQYLGGAISERLTSVVKNGWLHDSEKFSSIKNEKLLIIVKFGEIRVLQWSREIFVIIYQIGLKRLRSQNHTRARMIKLCDNLLKAEKLSYVVNTKDILFLAMDSIML